MNDARESAVWIISRHVAIQKRRHKKPQLKVNIIALAEPQSQADPKFQTMFNYIRITAKAMRIALMTEKGWQDNDLPCEKTMGAIKLAPFGILNRLTGLLIHFMRNP